MAFAKPFPQLQKLAVTTVTMRNTQANRVKVANQLDTISLELRTNIPPEAMLSAYDLHTALNGLGMRTSVNVIVSALRHDFNTSSRNFPASKKGGTPIATLIEAKEAVTSFWNDSVIYKGSKHAKHEPTGLLYIVNVGDV